MPLSSGIGKTVKVELIDMQKQKIVRDGVLGKIDQMPRSEYAALPVFERKLLRLDVYGAKNSESREYGAHVEKWGPYKKVERLTKELFKILPSHGYVWIQEIDKNRMTPLDIKIEKDLLLVAVDVERSYYSGSSGIARFNKVGIFAGTKESGNEYRLAYAEGPEKQYRDMYSSSADNYYQCIAYLEIEKINVEGGKLDVQINVIAAKGNIWTDNLKLKLETKQRRTATQEEIDKITGLVDQKAQEILTQVQKRWDGATYPAYHRNVPAMPVNIGGIGGGRPTGDATLPYDSSIGGKAVSKDATYGVFIIEEQIDSRVEKGRQIRWTVYKVTREGGISEVFEDHSYERLEEQARVAIAGFTSDGIVLSIRGGKTETV